MGHLISISYYSIELCYFKSDFSLEPLSDIISNKSLVIALRFPNARNQTLPLIYSGIPSIHISRTRFVLLTLSQFGKISVVHTLIMAFVLAFYCRSSNSFLSDSSYFSFFFLRYS